MYSQRRTRPPPPSRRRWRFVWSAKNPSAGKHCDSVPPGSETSWDIGNSTSQIVPLIVRSAALAVELSTRLRDEGLFIPAIRPPSVPPDESLLRLSITYDHSQNMLQQLVDALSSLRSLAADD